MPFTVSNILGLIGLLLRALGFLVVGFAVSHFVFENYKNSEWQLKIALALGLFGLLVGLTVFSSPGSAGAFALGAGGAYFMTMMPAKHTDENKSE